MRKKFLVIFIALLLLIGSIQSAFAFTLESTVWRGSTVITNSSGTFSSGQTWGFYGSHNAGGTNSMYLMMDKPLKNYTSNFWYSTDTSAPSCSWSSDPDNTQDIYHCTTTGSNKIYSVGFDVYMPNGLTHTFSVYTTANQSDLVYSTLHP